MGKDARIIVVDDDENIRKVLTAILEDEGYIVEQAATARAALQMTERKVYNLALIDIRLPDMEGIELLSKIKPTTPKMRKIVVTGFPTMQNAVEAVNRNADAYVLKPFNVKKVLELIGQQLDKQQEEIMFSQQRVADFIETRVRELESEKEVTNKKRR
jgi:DNA-binding NtrC family response regulator